MLYMEIAAFIFSITDRHLVLSRILNMQECLINNIVTIKKGN